MTMLLDRNVNSVLVDKNDEKDVPILKEDQDRINRFARLSSKVQVLEGELKGKKTERENLKDALAAVEEFSVTADEGETLRLSIGECYVEVSTETAEQRVQDMLAKCETDLTAINGEIDACHKEMEGLKVILYAKFGKTINLDLDPEE